jgi:hypothetical protein
VSDVLRIEPPIGKEEKMDAVDANGTVSSIKTVQTLMSTELTRVERMMQEAGKASTMDADGNGDQLLDAYLHIYTSLINGLASVEEALQWLRQTGQEQRS